MRKVLCIIVLFSVVACNPPDNRNRNQTGRIYDSLCASEKVKFDSMRSLENTQLFFLREQMREDSLRKSALKNDTSEVKDKNIKDKAKDPKKNTPPKKKTGKKKK